MNLLLDTHIAIWALNNDPRLSRKARKLLLDAGNTVYYSTVSVWEVLLKHARNPITLELSAANFSNYCKLAGYYPLSISDKHILAVETLQRPTNIQEHNDPFDRLLLAQAKVEHLSFLTHDSLILGYAEKCILPV